MPQILDQSLTFKAIEQRIARTTNPRHLMMLNRLLDHAKGEAAPDLDRVMATLSAHPHYHSWTAGPKMSPRGREAVLQFYVDEVVEAGRYFFEMDIDRMVVDDDTIITEGVMRTLYVGADLKAMGAPVDDPDGFYVMKTRLIIVWPYDADGMITGEDSYAAPPGEGALTKVDPADVPERFKAFVADRAARRAA